jgi:TonB-dependent SusC/RagA subfamily outer membrane receptor
MIFRGSINSIDPNTVESISVLKNAGETAIYGSQVGHGGVILIKTKRGGGK